MSVAMLFVLMDGHLQLFATLIGSFQHLPPGVMPAGGGWLRDTVIWSLDRVVVLAVSLSLPFEGAVLAITVAEGVVARAVPTINILMVTFAVKIMVVLMLMMAALPLIFGFLTLLCGMANAAAAGFLGMLTPL
jgi:flagellar biosynthetic protein FliR